MSDEQPWVSSLWAEGELPPRPAATQGGEPLPKPPARFQPIHRQQMVFRPVEVEQLLEPDHWAGRFGK